MIRIVVLWPDDWPLWRELRIEALREAAYAFCSKLADWQGEGDTEARWRKRLEAVPFNAIAHLGDTPAGMVSAAEPDGTGAVELVSMWVAPFARGRSVGDALVEAVVSWARAQAASTVVLNVMADNERASALYRRQGFVDVGAAEGSPGERRMAKPLSG